ncbi:hypothetical protein DINM_005991 [Dirofilaria immitis]|nr:hypothetical protein [Dirofilaria immitis]
MKEKLSQSKLISGLGSIARIDSTQLYRTDLGKYEWSSLGKDSEERMKSRDFKKAINSNAIPLLSQRARIWIFPKNKISNTCIVKDRSIRCSEIQAHYDEYSDDGDDSDKIYESDYMDNAYDEQVYIDNNGYHERFECHSHYPVKQPILASQKFPHMLSMSKPSSFKISPSSTGKSTRIAGRKRTTTNKSRKKAKILQQKYISCSTGEPFSKLQHLRTNFYKFTCIMHAAVIALQRT